MKRRRKKKPITVQIKCWNGDVKVFDFKTRNEAFKWLESQSQSEPAGFASARIFDPDHGSGR